jgi:CheY-like chemotaxis protein
MQKVEDPKPSISLPDECRRIAVWLSSGVKSKGISEKLKKMGVPCDIVDTPADFARYTHAFFDFDKYDRVSLVTCPNTKLIAISRNPLNDQGLPAHVKTIYTPITSLIAAGLLDEKSYCPAFSPQEAGESELRLHGTRFLVVDDNEINLVIAENTLLSYGGEVSVAVSGAEAIELVKENDYDIVFMDHMMPEIDGVDATRIIRALPGEKYAKLSIVALTANVVGDVREMFLESGMNDFLSKPLEFKEIERVLMEQLPLVKWSLEKKESKNV